MGTVGSLSANTTGSTRCEYAGSLLLLRISHMGLRECGRLCSSATGCVRGAVALATCSAVA